MLWKLWLLQNAQLLQIHTITIRVCLIFVLPGLAFLLNGLCFVSGTACTKAPILPVEEVEFL